MSDAVAEGSSAKADEQAAAIERALVSRLFERIGNVPSWVKILGAFAAGSGGLGAVVQYLPFETRTESAAAHQELAVVDKALQEQVAAIRAEMTTLPEATAAAVVQAIETSQRERRQR